MMHSIGKSLTLVLLSGLGSLLAAHPASAQGSGVRRHLVYFRDKANSPFSVAQPQAFL